MSIFSELLPKINAISIAFTKNFNDDLKAAFDCFDKFEEEFQHGRTKAREKAQKDKNHMTTLQSIHEDEDDENKVSDTQSDGTSGRSCAESNTDKPRRASKKRSKYEVDGLSSPEQDKRQKRNASVKAQTNITKQVNVNLTQKLRREDNDKKSTARRRKEDDKENSEPLLNIEIKQEKISLPPEPEPMEHSMLNPQYFIETESLPLNIATKQEPTQDDMAMPPPMAPVPKSRAKTAAKEKPAETSGEEETSGKRRTTRTIKQTDTAPAPVAASRSTRASSRSTKQMESEDPVLPPPQPEPRPKRTRAKKKVSEVAEPEKETQTPVEGLAASRPSSRSTKQMEPEDPVLPPPQPEPRPKRTRAKKKVSEVAEPEKETQTPVEGLGSPAEKPRPKRTRRGQKAAEKTEQNQEPVAPEPPISPKHEPVSQEVSSPNISQPTKETKKHKGSIKIEQETIGSTLDDVDAMDETRLLGTVNDMDKTVVLPKGVYNHTPVTPKNVRAMNETVVIEAGARETIVISKPQIMDATVVLEKEQCSENITDDNSLLTDDSEMHTPPKQEPPQVQPTSAVKEKVQQFEELASRVTRTKTRAMVKKEEEETETHTPPDKIVKQILSVETLNKMNNMIFNGKQISSSATKPRSNIPTAKPVPASASKLSIINKAREEAEARREKEDARKKKEAMLEAKREMHKRKREEKMAAAAAAREAAERSRRAAMEAAARERVEKQAHADLGKLERLKEAERKKIELARKVAETEERRRAEEVARQQRLAEEQRRADEARRKQLEEAAATKKEAALMTKEIEKRQKEYMEKQKMKQKKEDKIHTPLKGNGCALEPAYMADGFQYLNSDEDEEPAEIPVPEWSTYKARKQQLCIQSQLSSAHIDRLFSVRVHSPDLREIFPNIERARLKRTSSAVWRTPPARLPAVTE